MYPVPKNDLTVQNDKVSLCRQKYIGQ